MLPQNWVGKAIGGRYQIDALLGQGGMSAVYRAFDPNLRRTVAIKLIHPHLSTDPNFISRFKEEAAAIARLRHPNIVQVYDFNVDGEIYYMVMEYLIGETLQTRLKRLNATGRYLSFTDATKICIQICDAAGYAHNHELIHRDIKPANIMLDVNNQAILMDFGIVKIIGGEYHTVTGATIGTAMYMSPEQIRGERIDDRSDIYSVGVTLYEMVSSHPPYQADSAVTLMMMVLNDPLPDLRRDRKDIPDALLSVIVQALAKDKAKRYQSMAEMADALRQFETGLANIPLAETVAEGTPMITVETVTSVTSTAHIEGEDIAVPGGVLTLPQTEMESVSAYDATEKMEELIPAPPMQQEVSGEHVLQPQEPAHPGEKARVEINLRRFLLPAIGVLLLLGVILGGALYFTWQKLPSFQLVPIAHSSIPIDPGTAQNMVSFGTWQVNSYVVDMAFSPEGSLLATANNRDWVRLSRYRFYSALWQVEPGGLHRYLPGQSGWVFALAFSPDGTLLATVSEDASMNIWEVQSGALDRKIETTFGGVTSVDFSPNGTLLTAGTGDGYIGLWQVSNGNLLRTMPKQEYAIQDVEFSPDGSLVAAASDDGSVLIWSVGDGSLLQTLQGHTKPVMSIDFSSDGTLLASASEDYAIGIWKILNGKQVGNLIGHVDKVKDIAFSPDASLLVSGSDDGTVRIWQVRDGQLLKTFKEEESILSVAISPDGCLLASGGSMGTVHFWGLSALIP